MPDVSAGFWIGARRPRNACYRWRWGRRDAESAGATKSRFCRWQSHSWLCCFSGAFTKKTTRARRPVPHGAVVLKREFSVLLALAALLAVLAIQAPTFLAASNLRDILLANIPVLIASI